MEFGISQNNNIILPLIDWIDSSEKKIIHILYEAIFKFNSYIKEYPQYKEYLISHTDYNVGLQQTYLKIYQNKHVLWEFMDKYFIENRFIEQPPLMFYINLIKLMYKENILRDKFSAKSSTSIRVSEAEIKDDPFIERLKDCFIPMIFVEKEKIEYNLALLFNLYYNWTSYDYLAIIINEILLEMLDDNSKFADVSIKSFILYISKSVKLTTKESKNKKWYIEEIFKYLKIARIVSEKLIQQNPYEMLDIIYQILIQVLHFYK